jgi:hypothetical protein
MTRERLIEGVDNIVTNAHGIWGNLGSLRAFESELCVADSGQTLRELWKVRKVSLQCQAENSYRGKAFLKSSLALPSRQVPEQPQYPEGMGSSAPS